MKDMQGSLNAITRFKVFRYGIRATLLLSPVLYLLLWDTVIRSDVLSIIRLSFRFLSSTLTGEMARVQVSAVPEVVLWKGGWLPVYWSKLGDLTPYHGLFSMVYIIYLGSSVYKHGMKIRIITPAFSNIKSPETVKKILDRFRGRRVPHHIAVNRHIIRWNCIVHLLLDLSHCIASSASQLILLVEEAQRTRRKSINKREIRFFRVIKRKRGHEKSCFYLSFCPSSARDITVLKSIIVY